MIKPIYFSCFVLLLSGCVTLPDFPEPPESLFNNNKLQASPNKKGDTAKTNSAKNMPVGVKGVESKVKNSYQDSRAYPSQNKKNTSNTLSGTDKKTGSQQSVKLTAQTNTSSNPAILRPSASSSIESNDINDSISSESGKLDPDQDLPRAELTEINGKITAFTVSKILRACKKNDSNFLQFSECVDQKWFNGALPKKYKQHPEVLYSIKAGADLKARASSGVFTDEQLIGGYENIVMSSYFPIARDQQKR